MVLKIGLLGHTGLLGGEFLHLQYPGVEIIPIPKDQYYQITGNEDIEIQGSFDAIVNCTGYNNVHGCTLSPDKSFIANVKLPQKLNDYCMGRNIPFCSFSTDYVFPIRRGDKYPPKGRACPDDFRGNTEEGTKPFPCINTYAMHKSLAEDFLISSENEKLLLIRTSWLYGKYGQCFPKWFLSQEGTAKVFTNQYGCPTYTKMVAQATISLLRDDLYGLYHVCGSTLLSWEEFASILKRHADEIGIKTPNIEPTLFTVDNGTDRPYLSWLNCEKLEKKLIYKLSLDEQINEYLSTL